MDTLAHKKRIAKNTLLLYLRMGVVTLVGLFVSRIVLDALGEVDYGLYDLVAGIVVLFTFVQNAMVSTTQRFLTFEMGAGEKGPAQDQRVEKVFHASLTTHALIAGALLLVGETLGLWFLNAGTLAIPAPRMGAANAVYQFALLTTVLRIIQTPYFATIVAHERMGIYALVNVVEAALRLGVAYALLHYGGDALILYAGGLCAISVVVFLSYRGYCRRHFTTCRFALTWDKALLRQLIGFSGWSLCGSAANVMVTQGRSILLNLFYGLGANAALGITNKVNTSIYNFVAGFQTSFNPQITKSYAASQHTYLTELIHQTSKFSYYLLYLMAFPFILNAPFVLDIWLKQVPQYSAVFCSVILCYSLIDALSAPLLHTAYAIGRIRNYQLITMVISLAALPVSYVLLKAGWPATTLFWTTVICNGLNFLYRLLYLHRHMAFSLRHYAKQVLWPIALVTLLSLPLPLWVQSRTTGWTGFLCSTALAVGVSGICIILVGLTKSEKKHLYESIRHSATLQR